MGKIILKNVKMKGTNGGSIRNYDLVQMDDTDMEFTGDGLDIGIDHAPNTATNWYQKPVSQIIIGLIVTVVGGIILYFLFGV